MVNLIIIDSNIWLFGEIKDAPEHLIAIDKYKESAEKDEIGINAIIFSEVFHKLYRLYDLETAMERTDKIVRNPSISCLDFSRDTLFKAGKLAQDSRLRINDALIAQQALELDAKVLTDDIRDFRKVKGLEVIALR